MTDAVNVPHLDTGKERQARIAGGLLIALAVFVTGVFGLGLEGVATFRLSRPTEAMALPNLVVPAQGRKTLAPEALLALVFPLSTTLK